MWAKSTDRAARASGSARARPRGWLFGAIGLVATLTAGTAGLSVASVATPATGSWVQVWQNGFHNHTLAIDPADPSILYVGTAGSGIYKSVDGGSTWTSINVGLGVKTQGYVTSIVVDPTNSSIVYAGIVAQDTGRAEIGAGLFKSTNEGASWVAANSGIVDVGFGGPPADLQSILLDPANPQRMWAALQWGCGSIYWSTNGAGSWTRGVGLPCDEGIVRLHPTNSDILYTRAANGINRSTDGGVNWGPISSFGSCCVYYYGLAIDPVDPSIMYANDSAGVYRSSDGGFNWSFSLPLTDIHKALIVDPVRPSTVYAAKNTEGSAEILSSSDGGSTWTDISAGLPLEGVKNLFIPTNLPNQLWATTNAGVYVYGLPPVAQGDTSSEGSGRLSMHSRSSTPSREVPRFP